MDFALISTFLDLASSGSFSRTAERMHLTQSAVSARIRSLEQALNCRLFERDHNGAHLTEAGQRFIAYATSINRLWLQGRQDAAMGTDVVSQIGAGIHVCVWKC
jgi:DNA-binding transcriptional LysR family regulator